MANKKNSQEPALENSLIEEEVVEETPIEEESIPDEVEETPTEEVVEEEAEEQPEPVLENTVVEEEVVAVEEESTEEEPAVDYAAENATLRSENDALKAQIAELVEFKHGIERKQKEAMIDSFYMLSDEDKQEVVENIDSYSLDDIEAKLSIICVRNKVSFDLENDKATESAPKVFNLSGANSENDATPAWLKAVQTVAKNKR